MSGKMKAESKRLKESFRFTILQVFLVTLFENSPLWTLQKYFQKVHSPDSFAEVRLLSFFTQCVVTHWSPKDFLDSNHYMRFSISHPNFTRLHIFFIYIGQKYIILKWTTRKIGKFRSAESLNSKAKFACDMWHSFIGKLNLIRTFGTMSIEDWTELKVPIDFETLWYLVWDRKIFWNFEKNTIKIQHLSTQKWSYQW